MHKKWVFAPLFSSQSRGKRTTDRKHLKSLEDSPRNCNQDSKGQSLAENQKHQRAVKSVCNVKYSSLKSASLTKNDLHEIAYTPLQLTIRTGVNTLVKETNIKYEATTRYHFEILLFI